MGGSALLATPSRTDEEEADSDAVRTTVKAGISPDGIPEMFRILLSVRKSIPVAVDAFFATHPMAEDRITATPALIDPYPPSQSQGLVKDTPASQSFRRRLLASPPSPAPKTSQPRPSSSVTTARALPARGHCRVVVLLHDLLARRTFET